MNPEPLPTPSDIELRREIERLRKWLGMIGQIVHGNTRTTSQMADMALAGADPDDIDVWRKF